MRAIDKAIGRPGIVLGLLVVAGVGLRGDLPGTAPVHQRPRDEPSSPAVNLILLGASIAFFGVALIVALRRGQHPPGGADPAQLPEWLTRRPGESGRRRWGVVLIGAGLIVLCLTLGLLLAVPGPREAAVQQYGSGDTEAGDTAPAPAPAPAQQPEPDTGVPGMLGAADAVAVVLLAVGSALVYAQRRRAVTAPPPAGLHPPAAADAESLAWATELALAEIADTSRGPREAIIASYATLERALADAPEATPRDSDTPSEVLARAIGHHALRGESATELVVLFAEARFSTHVMTEDQRDTAIDALAVMLAELRQNAAAGGAR